MSKIFEVDIKGYKAQLPVLSLPSGVNIAFFVGIMVIIALGAIDYMNYAWPYFFR